MTQEQPEALIAEYRPSMPHEVLHDWAKDAVAELRRLHAENEALRRDSERLDWLLWKLPGDALRYVVGELSDTSSDAEFRAAIDAAMKGRS
jgi:hypothetical protein